MRGEVPHGIREKNRSGLGALFGAGHSQLAVGQNIPGHWRPVFAILLGMAVALFYKKKERTQQGLPLLPRKFSSTR